VTYRIDVLPAARRSLAKVRGADRRRIEAALLMLAAEPRPPAARHLGGSEVWRVRVGSYRILYTIDDGRLVVLVVTVGHRREVYRDWHGP
jgi:mRNA interferase RelE/StbE